MSDIVNPTQYYDEHTLHVTDLMAVGHNKQLIWSIKEAINSYSKSTGRPFPCDVKANMIKNKQNSYVGLGFVWVSNPEIYRMLIGLNPDGSERFSLIDDPSWIQSPPISNSNIESSEGLVPSLSSSWADAVDEEEASTPSKIKVPLEPLLKLPDYKYDEHQITALKTKPNYNNETTGTFQLKAAFVVEDEEYSSNVLKASGVAKWVSENDILGIFSPYISSSRLSSTLNSKGSKGSQGSPKSSYPRIKMINSDAKEGKKTVIVTFDPSNHEALFALHMNRKVEFTKGSKKTLLFFGLGYRSS
jgi:hypothetical protein